MLSSLINFVAALLRVQGMSWRQWRSYTSVDTASADRGVLGLAGCVEAAGLLICGSAWTSGIALSALGQPLPCRAQPPGDDERERHHERDRDLPDGRRRDARRDLQQRLRAAVAGPGGAEDHHVRLCLLFLRLATHLVHGLHHLLHARRPAPCCSELATKIVPSQFRKRSGRLALCRQASLRL